MSDVLFHERFSPAEATRGQYVPVDTSTLSDYPATGSRGRYAQLNYIIGSEPGALSLALSGGTVILPVSTVNISEPVSVENAVGDRLDVTIQEPISSFITNTIDVTEQLTNTTQVCSQTIGAQSSAVIAFSPTVNFLEIYNKDTADPVYIGYDAALTYAQVNARGIPIEGEAYYSVDREVSSLVVTNPDTSPIDVSIFGHYRV